MRIFPKKIELLLTIFVAADFDQRQLFWASYLQ